jgi:hypothetical protein
MANRSYLYTIRKENSKVNGICECNYDIPLIFKILVSDNTQMIPSKIFQNNEFIALQGDFQNGKIKLYHFLDKLLSNYESSIDDLVSKVENTKNFFETIIAEYFYLDCAEIYDMHTAPLEEQNKKLFNEINNIHIEIEKFYKNLDDVIMEYTNLKNSFPNKGLFLNTRKEKAKQELKQVKRKIDNMLFLDYWTNTLYYDI